MNTNLNAKRLLPAVIALTLSASGSSLMAQQKDSITIYSSAQPGSISPDTYRPIPGQHQGYYHVPGYAVIKSTREYNIQRGINQLEVSDVAALLDPTTVSFRSKDDPDARVLEQNYQFDLVSQQKLLQKYLGKNITVEQSVGDKVNTISGELVSATGGLILKDKSGNVHSINNYSNISFPSLPGGLRTKPTLVWQLDANKSGKQDIELSYQTQGMTWWSDYNIIYDEKGKDNCKMDLAGWVSIINQSGADFADAKLKLIAGDVNRAQPDQNIMITGSRVKRAMAEMADEGFQEKTFFEYHMYTLGRPANIPNNSTKQLELFPNVTDIACTKELVFDASSQFGYYGGINTNQGYGHNSQSDVNVYLRFKNDKKNNMGIPLPAGRIRVNQRDDDGSLEFIGEDIIDHTPKDEDVLIKMGNSFDIKGERKQTNYQISTDNKELRESFEITIKNHKSEDAEVVIRETLYRWSNWKITSKSHDFTKQDSRHIHFNVKVPANSEIKVRYDVKYTW
ncbi:MAG: DUF4139 domain-containing protein [Kangiellaceae bacterium]|nr:DUF4139 domain-containing protein [Kangiellaceae bacterium]